MTDGRGPAGWPRRPVEQTDLGGVGPPDDAIRITTSLVVFGLMGLAGVAMFMALGLWQVERRVWKLDLIERIEQRVHAAPSSAPGPALWAKISARRNEYQRVSLTGHYLNGQETLVQAATGLGSGYWVLTPLRSDEGFTVLINRGFVPPDRRDPRTRETGQVQGDTIVTGLLRLSEPKGGFLRRNAPDQNRWYSRDVTAIAAARGLGDVAPYFIDAGASATTEEWPRGGLTVVAFPNNHLVYALTWFSLALMLVCALTVLGYRLWRDRPPSHAAATPATGPRLRF